MPTNPTPVLFIHGLWLHATSWQPWMDLFAEHGYAPSAPGWPGDGESVEATRADADSVANRGVEEVTEHYAKIIGSMEQPPVLVGHSFGGLLVEKLLGEGLGKAGIAIDAAQIKGVLPLPISALHATLPVFKNPANKHRAVSLTSEQFRFAFGNAVSAEESDELFERWTIPAPGRPLFEAAAANFSLHSPTKVRTDNSTRGPLLLIMGGQDHTVPEAITKSTLKQYKHSTAVTDLIEFADRGHSLVVDSGWRQVAESCLSWLDAQEL
jgi:alpha-beta hydrolase superfamily lysophospholipase